MTLSVHELLIYAGAVFILVLPPGPVWMALTARTLSGGFRAAWPLALGVVVGDAAWPVLAYLGVTWVVSASAMIAVALKFVAAAMFVTLGVLTIRNAGRAIEADTRLTRPGAWAGFAAGVVVILSNPKAVLFYIGLLPGFFDLTRINGYDLAVIVAISQLVPLLGNLAIAGFVHRVRGLLSSPSALRRTNLAAGALLISVGLIIPFT
jgi:threonine/homoserine/homoserine lactone efflux protein